MIKAIRIGVAALAASAVLAGCVTVGAQEKEGQLAAAGFVRQPADTPLKMTKLQALPQNTIVVGIAHCDRNRHMQRQRKKSIPAIAQLIPKTLECFLVVEAVVRKKDLIE